MNIEASVPTTKNPPEQFAGDVWLDVFLEAGDDPEATTTWKEHVTDAEFDGSVGA
ncbi:hypothetical protein [Microbacterium sp. NPDC087665]|uniref:hypothetical protein n=1 Tax=Microbacterium sp. NPDC087665 TaxID=3364194 RepID=UPI0038305738